MAWKMARIVEGHDDDGRRVPFTVGVWECEDGRLVTALQRGEHGDPAVFVHTDEVAEASRPTLFAGEHEIDLSVKVRQAIAERMKMAGES